MDGNIGFIGLGAMGYPMAKNVRIKMPGKATLFINDAYMPSCERFVAEFSSHGPIVVVKTAREAAENAKAVISIVPAAQHVRAVYLDATDGVIGAKQDSERLLLECSTIDVKTTREVGEAVGAAGAGTYIDAPVSGGVPGADAATLAFLIGSQPPPSAHPLLPVLAEYMGSPAKFFYVGGLGAGLAAKIANNYLSGVHLLAAAEAMNIGIRSGVDKTLLYNVIHASTGQSFMLDHVCPTPGVVPQAPSSNDYKGGFKAQMMVKDMSLGVDAARALGVRATTGAAALELYKEAAVDERCIDRDVSVVWRFLDGPE